MLPLRFGTNRDVGEGHDARNVTMSQTFSLHPKLFAKVLSGERVRFLRGSAPALGDCFVYSPEDGHTIPAIVESVRPYAPADRKPTREHVVSLTLAAS